MSFDLKVENGDLSFDLQGRLNLVRDADKIIQDVLKIVQTTRATDPFDARYGLTVSTQSIGKVAGQTAIAQTIEAELKSQLDRFAKEQTLLASRQSLTAAERIQQIDNVSVQRDANEPRQLNISIELTTQSQEPISIQSQVRI